MPCLLIAPSRCLPPRRVLARDQPQIAGHLTAVLEPVHIPDGQHKGQRGNRTHSWLRHQQPRLRVLLQRIAHRFVHFAIAVDQLPFRHFAGLRIENRRLLPTGMKITSYNFIEGFS